MPMEVETTIVEIQWTKQHEEADAMEETKG